MQEAGQEVLVRHAHSGHFDVGKSALLSDTPKARVPPTRQAHALWV